MKVTLEQYEKLVEYIDTHFTLAPFEKDQDEIALEILEALSLELAS